MTVMSQVSAEKFSQIAKVVFPQDSVFDPVDYLDAFNLHRSYPLGENTFKKYVSIVAGSRYFPNLTKRVVLSGETGGNFHRYIITAKDSVYVEKPTIALSAGISDKALNSFKSVVKEIMSENVWYKPETIRRYYNRSARKKLKIKTFKNYLGLLFNRNLWKGLKRRKVGNKMYQYKWEEQENVSVTPSVEYETVSPPKDRYLVQTTCSSCGGHSPVSAKFCMHCGDSLGPTVRIAVQESFFPLNISKSSVQNATEEELLASVRRAVELWSQKCVIRRCTEENGVITYTVSGETK